MGVDVMWFSPDGLVKEQHTYMDMGTIMSQIGASEAEGAPGSDRCPTGAPAVVVSMSTPEETKNVEAATKMWARVREEERSRLPRPAPPTTSPGTT